MNTWNFKTIIKKQPPGFLIAVGFLMVILIGAVFLLLPVSVRSGKEVTVVAILIQVRGLGVTSVGVGFILAVRKRVGMKGRLLVKEALNVGSYKGIVRLVKCVLFMTLGFEAAGTALSYLVFSKDYPPLETLGISLFHSIAAFNNSGFDILGGLSNLIPYQRNMLLNLTTSGLIIFGGLGFLVILDIWKKRSFQKLCLHSKVVITTSLFLLAAGTILLKTTEDISWLGAFFQSVSARTAGFPTYSIGEFTNAGLLTLAGADSSHVHWQAWCTDRYIHVVF